MPRVLVVPLDWGLGHATRCIPLIRQLLVHKCTVLIGAEGAVRTLLEAEFQELTFIPVHGYQVRYASDGKRLALKMLLQAPRIFARIFQEHSWLKKVVKSHRIDAVISDNRFGLSHASIPCVYITHQLQVKTGSAALDRFTRALHYYFINKYDECWVPDLPGQSNLAGELSHPVERPAQVRYIGPLSRLERRMEIQEEWDLLVLLSGPEPQRSIFERLLWQQLKRFEGRVLVVRGLPGQPGGALFESAADSSCKHLTTRNHLPAEALGAAMQASRMIVCRSGYTTVMDLLRLRQPAILVPTPGQTEQEYLAWHLMKQDLFYSAVQEGFSLQDAMTEAAAFPFANREIDMEQYKAVINEFITALWGEPVGVD